MAASEQGGMIASKAALDIEVIVGRIGGHAPARSADEEAELNQIGLVDFLNGIGFLGNGGGDGVQSNGAAMVFFEDRQHNFLIDFIEAEAIHFEQVEGGLGDGLGDAAVGTDLGVIAYAAQEAIGDARRSAATAGEFGGGIVIDNYGEQAGGALHDDFQFVDGIGIEPQHQTEAATERGAD